MKMQPTQPLAQRPTTAAPAPVIQQAQSAMSAPSSGGGESDPLIAPLSMAAAIAALAAIATVYLAFSATAPQG
jgi:hypothetical protein